MMTARTPRGRSKSLRSGLSSEPSPREVRRHHRQPLAVPIWFRWSVSYGNKFGPTPGRSRASIPNPLMSPGLPVEDPI